MYPKDWVEQVEQIYLLCNKGSRPINHEFFENIGEYYGRSKMAGIPNNIRSEHFKNLLYAPNYAVLDYIIKNKKQFEKTINLDTGCGLGILPIFLDKIGIKCVNYDNYSQIEKDYTNIEYSEVANRMIDLYNDRFNRTVAPVINKIHQKPNVVICSGCAKIQNTKLLEADLYLVDTSYIGEHPYVDVNFKKDFVEIYEYPKLAKVFRKK